MERKRILYGLRGEALRRTPKSLLNMPASASGERLQAISKYLPKRDQRPRSGPAPASIHGQTMSFKGSHIVYLPGLHTKT